jgi:hypothetical protein
MFLNQLANKHNTDKSNLYHNYADIYELFFYKFKDQNINLLEIGVLLGNSLRMWKEYFPKGNIFGIDINPECKKCEEDRIKIFIGNQNDDFFLNEIVEEIKELDIIIDDGSHIIDHQIKSFMVLFPKLKENGLYVIEDLHSSYSPNPVFNNKNYTTIDFLKERIDDIQFNGKNVDDIWYADKKNHYKTFNNKFELNYYEKWIRSIHFYKSICFIEKDTDWLQ